MHSKYPWRTGKHCVTDVQLVLVFATIARGQVLNPDVLEFLEEVFSQTVEQMGGKLIKFAGKRDVVQITLIVDISTAISSLISKLKAKSSFLLKRGLQDEVKTFFQGSAFWSKSHCVVSSGASGRKLIDEFILAQSIEPSEMQIQQSLMRRGKIKKKSDAKDEK